MSSPSRVVVVAEDQRHKSFAQRYLERIGFNAHQIYFESLPSARGCGEQWVRNRYAKNVAAYRDRAARAESALVVIIDADTGDRSKRIQQLAQALASAGATARTAQERIAHVVPKRSIETWVLYFDRKQVDEDTNYSGEPDINDRIPAAAAGLFELSRPKAVIPSGCLPSIVATIPEVRRLES